MSDEKVDFRRNRIPNLFFVPVSILKGISNKVGRIWRPKNSDSFDCNSFMLEINASFFELSDNFVPAELNSSHFTLHLYLLR